MLGFPLGVLLSIIYSHWIYTLLVILPWGSHIVADYLGFHVVRPLSPFSNKTLFVGWFRLLMYPDMKGDGRKSLSEGWVTLVVSLILISSLLIVFV